MNQFCTNCGKQLAEGEQFCSSCGTPANAQTAQAAPVYNGPTTKVPGKGASIAGMVLGIIACFWTLISTFSMGNIEEALLELESDLGTLTVGSAIAFALGFTFFAFIPSLVGLPLSVSGCKKHKSGINIAGIVLNSIALLVSIIVFIYVISFV